MNSNNQHDEILARGRLNLEANQQGQMTPQQKDWLKQDMKEERQRQYQLVFVSCIVFLIVAIVLVLMPFLPVPILIVPFVWGVGVVSWYGYVWMQQKPIRDDLEAELVEAVTGYVDKKNVEQGFMVTIDGVDYVTHPDMYPIFDDIRRYIAYVIPKSKIILSAQAIIEADEYNREQ